jgi:hypothetical protein
MSAAPAGPSGSSRSSFVAPPPWRMVGESVVAFVGGGGGSWGAAVRGLLPPGVRSLPGPAVVVGVSYTSSPVGPFVELSVGVPARLGLRPGLCVVFQVVSVPEARTAYRSGWGLPATSEPSLTWSSTAGSVVELSCPALGFSLSGTAAGPGVPMVVPMRSLQHRTDGPVVLPRRLLARVRRARTSVHVEGGAPAASAAGAFEDERSFLSLFAGDHPGICLSGARILARPARQPAGLWSSLRAPLVVGEPAVFVGNRPVGEGSASYYSRLPHRALSSVG